MDLRTNLRNELPGKKKELNLENFGEIMDEIISKSKLGLMVMKEENSEEFIVKGAGCGAVMDFYIFLNAIQPIFLQMLKEMKYMIDADLLAESLCEELRKTLVKAAEEEEHERTQETGEN